MYVDNDDEEEDKTSGQICSKNMICILSWCEILARCTPMAANFIQCDIRRDSTALYTDSHTQDIFAISETLREICNISRNPVKALLPIFDNLLNSAVQN